MAKKPKAAAPNETPGIRITSTRPGFRRAGIAHPAEAVTYPVGTFTEEQLEQLENEPVLIVETVEGAPDETQA